MSKKYKIFEPAQHGVGSAYGVEYKDEHGNWKWLEAVKSKQFGITVNRLQPCVEDIIGLMSYDAAMSMAWALRANTEFVPGIDVRIVRYKLTYNIEAKAKAYTDIPRQISEDAVKTDEPTKDKQNE